MEQQCPTSPANRLGRAKSSALVLAALAACATLAWPSRSASNERPEGLWAAGRLALQIEPRGTQAGGSLSVSGLVLPFEGRYEGARLEATFRYAGEIHTLRAERVPGGLSLASGGASHFLKPRARGNPLADPTLSLAFDGTASTPLTPAPPSAGGFWNLPGGTRVPRSENFEARVADAVLEVVPLAQADQGAAHTLAEVPWQGGLGPTAAALFDQFAVGLAADATRVFAPRQENHGGRLVLIAAYRAASLGRPDLEVRIRGIELSGVLLLAVSVGDSDSLDRAEAHVRAWLAGAVGAPSANHGHAAPPTNSATLDSALFGRWRNSESHSDWRHGASMVFETFYDFSPDGTYAFGSQAAGGGFSQTYDAPATVRQRGTWQARDGVLSTRSQDGQTGQVAYTFHEGRLVFKLDRGGYTFWHR